jgi:hypothetical protein
MKYRIGSKAGNLARVLAVMIITMALLVGAMIPSAPVLADDSSSAYLMSNSPFTYGEGAVISDGMGVWDSHSNKVCMSMVNVVWRLDGNTDIDCGIYIANSEESEEVFTVYYEHGQKGVMEEAMLTALNASCYDYAESLFVPTDGVYEYQGDPVNWSIDVPGEGGMNVAPPTLETYIPQPVTDSRSVCRIPNMWRDEEGGTSYSYAFMSRGSSEGNGCPEWEAIWDSGYLYPSMPMVMAGSSDLEEGTQIIRTVLPFDTSDIPEGAIITGAYMRCVLYLVARMDGDDATYVLGGTNNISFLPLTWTDESLPEELGNYSETEFYGNFGAVNTSDCPPEAFEGAMDSRVYVDFVLNENGLDYVNTEGFTALTLRESNEINEVCPPPSTAFYFYAGAVGTQYYTQYPESFLVVDWHMPGEGGAGLVSPQIAVMMDIVAILFLTGFIIGLLFVIAKSEGMPLAAKAGVITTIAVMAVVGVIIIESLIVAFK